MWRISDNKINFNALRFILTVFCAKCNPLYYSALNKPRAAKGEHEVQIKL